ncbi:MAG: ATP-binding protein [Lachnospiraceae bacterium]|nr:ATP-binding protein [Lachnospiraceae bacterium]
MPLKYNISYEVASTIFLIILLFYIRLQYDTNSTLNTEFQKLTWFGLIATMLDVISAVTISYATVVPTGLNILLNTLYFLSVAALGYQLTHYNLFYLYRNNRTSPFMRFNQILICFYAALLIYNIFSGCFFSFTEDGTYVKGPAHLAVYISPCYFVTCSAIILIYNFRRFRGWQRLSICLFVIFQVAGTLLQMFVFPDTLLALFMSALGLMMMLFTMETPDYQKLVITIEELSETKKVAEKAKEEAERAKEIAQEANRAKSDFLANMSHEIRTPINAVLGMDEMILRESTDSKISEYASDIKQAGNMLLSLINDILDFSKIESGKMDIIPVDYDLGILLGDTIDMIRSRAEEKKLKLELNIESNTPVHLHGDEVRLRQIITNILTNAVKYTPEGKVVLTVSGKKVSAEAVQLYVSVKDTGIGIKKEDIGRLFDSFQRVDESRNRNIEGTGLGLSITMRLLNLMGSRLQVESTYGEGSDFYFYLEQKQLDDEVIGENIQKYYETEKGKMSISTEQFYAPDAKILVVDDNEMNLKVFLGLLKNHGIQIDTAMSGKECLERMEKHAYHIIFMDHLMPEMDGVETFRRIRELKTNRSKDAVIIILTANAVSGAREMFLQEGFADYLSKPVIAAKLEKMIQKYLPAELISINDSRQKEEIPAAVGDHVKSIQAQDGLVDWKKGKLFCMEDEKFYREMLQIFLDSPSAVELRRYYEESDFENYRIKIHAMKTNLANIGATSVSEMAKQLELALKNENNVSYVQEHHDEFMAAYRNVVSEVKAYIANEYTL